MDVEVIHVPVHVGHHEVHSVEDVQDFQDRKVALVVHPTAVRVRVGFVEPLALGHERGVADGDASVLVNVRARSHLHVAAQNSFHVCHGVGVFLGAVVVEVTHQGFASAVAVAVRLGNSKRHVVAVVNGLAAFHVFHHQAA